VVLSRFAAGAVICLIALPSTAYGQRIDSTAPIIDLPDGLKPVGVRAGSVVLLPSAELRAEYDSNIYAEPNDPVDDVIMVLTPRVEARRDSGTTRLGLLAEAQLRRYLDNKSENSTAGAAEFNGEVDVSRSQLLQFGFGWRRAIEDRGDPEASDIPTTGPRRLDIYSGDAGWSFKGSRFSLALNGSARRINYASVNDRTRDLDTFSGQATVGYRIGGTMRAIVTGFLTKRDFRLDRDLSGINRNAKTYGGRIGLSIEDTGFLRGEATIGVFHFSPSDPTLPARTGISAQASLVYLPSRRVAVTLDAFRGDVATVRSGAQARTDTTFRLGVQAEARSNLRLQGQVFYRDTKFVGSGISERTIGASAEAEYVLNRFLSLAATVNYADRTSDRLRDRFERTRASIELRARF